MGIKTCKIQRIPTVLCTYGIRQTRDFVIQYARDRGPGLHFRREVMPMSDFSFAELYSFLITLYCMYLSHKCRKGKRELEKLDKRETEKNNRTPRQR